MKAKIFGLLLILFSLTAIGQKKALFSFQGKIIDSASKQPLPYAHIKILKSNQGTTTNKEGIFSILYLCDSIELEISFVGYENKKVKLFTHDNTIIKLDPASILLEELVITNENPSDFVWKSISNLPYVKKNTFIKNTAFYREIVSENSKFTEFAEGVLEIHRYDNKNDIILKKAQKAKDLKQYELSKVTTITLGGPHKLLKNDINYHLPLFLQIEHFNEFQFKQIKITSFNNEDVKVFGFAQIDSSKKQFLSGEITLTSESNEIVKVVYTEKTKSISNFLMKMFGFEFHGDEQKTSISYQKLNDKWVLKSIQKDSKVYMSRTKKGIKKDFDFLINSQLIITEHSYEKSIQKPQQGYIKPGKEFGKQVSKYDENFWLEYSTLNTTKEQNILLKELKNQNKSNR